MIKKQRTANANSHISGFSDRNNTPNALRIKLPRYVYKLIS